MTVEPSAAGERTIELAARLVRTPSVLGGEEACVRLVAEEMERLDFDRVGIDRIGNAVGVIDGARPGPTLLLDGHLDTVDVHPRDAWSRDPFSGAVADGRLHGRGSADMKGAVAAMVHGAGGVDRDRLAGRIVVSASVGEETIEGAALREVMAEHPPTFVVVGEATGLDLARAGRGRAELVVETRGRPAHASTPELGVNAVLRMFEVAREITSLPRLEHPFVGHGITCLTDIVSVPWPAHSVVPSGCRATFERRLVPGETRESLLERLREACARAGAADSEIRFATTAWRSWTGVEVDEPKWFPPWETAEESPIVQRSLAALRGLGESPRLVAYRFCTNAAWSAGRAGVPTVGYGPATETEAHVVDESVDLDQLRRATAGYRALCEALLAP